MISKGINLSTKVLVDELSQPSYTQSLQFGLNVILAFQCHSWRLEKEKIQVRPFHEAVQDGTILVLWNVYFEYCNLNYALKTVLTTGYRTSRLLLHNTQRI